MAPAGPLCTGLSNIKKAPKWTMTGRDNSIDRAIEKRIKNAPGPGQYGNPDTLRFGRQPRALFGTCERDSGFSHQAQKPGPTAYDPKPFGSSVIKKPPAFRFGGAERVDESLASARRARTPGPGSYDIKPMLDKMSPLITSRSVDRIRSQTPGPGAYTTPRGLRLASGWKFGRGERPEGTCQNQKGFPGPGTYAVQSTVGGRNPLISSMPSFTLTPRRVDLAEKANRGAGTGKLGGCYTTFGY